jgi:uncharacterized membrane protein
MKIEKEYKLLKSILNFENDSKSIRKKQVWIGLIYYILGFSIFFFSFRFGDLYGRLIAFMAGSLVFEGFHFKLITKNLGFFCKYYDYKSINKRISEIESKQEV